MVKYLSGGDLVRNSIRFLLSMIFLFFILTACSNTEIIDKEIQESSNDSTIEKSELDYQIGQGKIYNLLVDEYLETNDQNNPNIHVMFRKYQIYDGNNNNVYLNIESVSLPNEVATIPQAKDYLHSNNTEWLKLKPLTIISEKVLNQWKSEEYVGENEYWSGSPMELTLEIIINSDN